MAIKVRKQAAASVETPPDTHVQFFVDTDGLPKLKDSLDVVTDAAQAGQVTLNEQLTDPPAVADKVKLYSKDVGGIAEFFARDDQGNVIQITSNGDLSSTIVGSTWVNRSGGGRVKFTTLGLHTIVPAPPAGTVRVIDVAPFRTVAGGVMLGTSNGTSPGPGVNANWTLRVGGITVLESGGAYVLTGAVRLQFPIVLGPGEALELNITAFQGGATMIYGRAMWFDFDATGVQVVRKTFTNLTPFVVIPPVPAGKMAVAYSPGQALGNLGWDSTNPPGGGPWSSAIGTNSAQSVFVNRDTGAAHSFQVAFSDPDGGVFVLPNLVDNIYPATIYNKCLEGQSQLGYYTQALVEGQSLTLTMQEPLSGVDPVHLFAMYKLIDLV